jgi:DNA-directed RNA polymerase specialized sigma24 family protein
MAGAERSSNRRASACKFEATHWSVVLALGQGDSTAFTTAFEELCSAYWYPLYAHIRQRGHSSQDAQDLTQGFFLHLLVRKPFTGLDPSKGRFRSFLLAALKLFLADQRDHQRALKRGGGCEIVSIDAPAAEARYGLEPVDNRSPDRLFEQRWALALLDRVLVRLEQDYADTDRTALFRHLRPFLVEGGRIQTCAAVAGELGLTEEAVKKAVQRMRWRYGRLFREEIAHTVADPAEVEEELRYLRQVMAE